MHHRRLTTLAAGTVLLLAACSGGGGATTAPTTASEAPASEAPAAEVCAESSAAGDVMVAIENFEFNPADVQAGVGQTITFTNGDSAPHTATPDDGACTTPQIPGGSSAGLVFNVAGSYPFHCEVHPTMKGTITIG